MVLYLGICFTVVTVLYIVVEGIKFKINKELTTIKFNKIIEKDIPASSHIDIWQPHASPVTQLNYHHRNYLYIYPFPHLLKNKL